MIMYMNMYMKMIMIMSMIMRVGGEWGKEIIKPAPARVEPLVEDSFPFPSFSVLKFIFSQSIVFQPLPCDT